MSGRRIVSFDENDDDADLFRLSGSEEVFLCHSGMPRYGDRRSGTGFFNPAFFERQVEARAERGPRDRPAHPVLQDE